MVLLGLAGLRFDADGVRFQPCLPDGIARVELRNVNYRKMRLDITIRGSGTKLQEMLVNGQKLDTGLLAADREGRQEITIRVAKE
jgi:trehalose/maltose hydrolase-like predicted phosphorylase